MSKASGYSLWLVPAKGSETHNILTQCIDDIAQKHQTPRFNPHVTLLGGLKDVEERIYDKTKKLAREIRPYEIKLGEVGSNGIYFQALFSKIEQTEEVVQANTVAQKMFGVNKGVYFPHASLAYGDFSPKTVADLQQQIANYRNPIAGKEFLVKGIQLWHTEGEVKNWSRVTSFALRL